MKISVPGLYSEIAIEQYHADPCPQASLSQSIAKILLAQSPLHAWWAHPRLNPDFEHDAARKFDLGNVAHRLLLDRGRDIVPLPYADWRTKAAQELRQAAIEEGKIACLAYQYEQADAMQRVIRTSCAVAMDDRKTEVAAIWREGSVWMRSLIDWATDEYAVIYDYKTTDYSVAPDRGQSLMLSAGWDIQAAFQERGLDVLNPENAGRRKFRFIAQETAEPYCFTVFELDESAMTMGRKKVQRAVDLWNLCTKSVGAWPGYPAQIQPLSYPAWAEAKWLERELAEVQAEQERADINILSGG